MNSKRIASFSVFVFVLLASIAARADVRLPAIFSDNMVLQQGAKVPVWGWAEEGEVVTVRLGDQIANGKTKDGKWMVKLRTLNAGGPDLLIVQGKNRIEIKNVLVGEGWGCSG